MGSWSRNLFLLGTSAVCFAHVAARCDAPHHRDHDVTRVPDQFTETCPVEGADLTQSWEYGFDTTVYFKNRASTVVDLFWIDSSGSELLKGSMAPGEVMAQETLEGHVFHVRSSKEDGAKLLLRHRVGLMPLSNPLGVTCSDDLQSDLPLRQPLEGGFSCGYIFQGFKNRVGCAVNVWFWNGTAERAVAQLGTRLVEEDSDINRRGYSQNAELVYLDHTFRVRTPNGQLVQEFMIDKVYIDDCRGWQQKSVMQQPAILVNPLQVLPEPAESGCVASVGKVCELSPNRRKPLRMAVNMEEQEDLSWQLGHACLLQPCNLSPLELSQRVFVRTGGSEL